MGTLYVKELFGLLRFLDIEQQRVVACVGPNKAQVSLWAHGKRPVPKKLTLTFLDFVDAAITTAWENAWQRNPPPPPESTLLYESPAHRFEREVRLRLDWWALECYEATGALRQEHAAACRVENRYRHLDPSKLNVDEAKAYLTASNTISRTLRHVIRLKTGTDTVDSRPLSSSLDKTPSEYFRFLAKQFLRGASEEDEEESDE